MSRDRVEHVVKIIWRLQWKGNYRYSGRSCLRLQIVKHDWVGRVSGVEQDGQHGRLRDYLAQKFEQLGRYVLVQTSCAGCVIARMSEACNQTSAYRVVHISHDYRHGRIEALRRAYGGGTVRHNNTRIFLGQFIRECRKAIIVASREALLEHVVATIDQSVVSEPLYDRAALRSIGTWWRLATKKPNNYGRLLRK